MISAVLTTKIAFRAHNAVVSFKSNPIKMILIFLNSSAWMIKQNLSRPEFYIKEKTKWSAKINTGMKNQFSGYNEISDLIADRMSFTRLYNWVTLTSRLR